MPQQGPRAILRKLRRPAGGVPPPLHAHPAAGPAAPTATLIQVQPKTAQRKDGRLGGAPRRRPAAALGRRSRCGHPGAPPGGAFGLCRTCPAPQAPRAGRGARTRRLGLTPARAPPRIPLRARSLFGPLKSEGPCRLRPGCSRCHPGRGQVATRRCSQSRRRTGLVMRQ